MDKMMNRSLQRPEIGTMRYDELSQISTDVHEELINI